MSKNNNLAFLFPGQGSQKVGMMSDLAAAYPLVQETFSEASDVLGYDLWDKVSKGPEADLNSTETTQPALLTASIAAWRVWQGYSDIRPAYLAGHSLGEWSALVAAEVITFEDAVRLVRLRGKFMQEAVPAGKGAMAAIIGLSDEQVQEACALAEKANEGLVVSPVNYNSPGQLVIAGDKTAVDSAIALASDLGAKRALLLPVSAPFHTSLMKPAADRLATEMENTNFSAPAIPVVHNVTAELESSPEKIRALMIEQIYSPVRWVSCVQSLGQKRVDTVVECGPGKVLVGLCKRIDRSLSMLNIETAESLAGVSESLNKA